LDYISGLTTNNYSIFLQSTVVLFTVHKQLSASKHCDTKATKWRRWQADCNWSTYSL